MLRYREGEPLVELVQHLAAAATNADYETGAGAGAPAPGEPEGAANGGAAATGAASSAAPSAAAAPPPPLPPRVEVRVPADAASNQNRQVRARQLWGEWCLDFFLRSRKNGFFFSFALLSRGRRTGKELTFLWIFKKKNF